jgi:hypothetical protein
MDTVRGELVCLLSHLAHDLSSWKVEAPARCASAGWVARVGSAAFLCVQILMLLDFVTSWNDSWVDKDDERSA